MDSERGSPGLVHGRSLNTPVLFLVFNRPETTARVFEAIRRARPPRLYVAADGPRPDKEGEARKVREVRELVTRGVDWDCRVRTLFRDGNLGCRRAVSGALDWFFDGEECGIVLEDDCLPSPSWFRFAEEMLERYRDDERVMCVSANHFHGDAHRPSRSYFFSVYNHCWGWASWRRAWRHYDRDMRRWPALKHTSWLLGVGNGDPLFRRYWTRIFQTAYEGRKVDSWAYRWTFSCWSQNGLTILPARNLVRNIGLGSEATHTKSGNPVIDGMELEELEFPLEHPECVVEDVEADRWAHRNVFGISTANWLKARMRETPFASKAIDLIKKTSR